MLSILTFNLRFGLANDAPPHHWDRRKEILPSLFEKYHADFIGFQEVNGFQADFLRNILSEYKTIGKRSPAPKFWQHNLIFYKKKWECVYAKHFFLSPTPMIPSRSRKSVWPRQCTLGMFETDGRRIICLNTHFDFDAAVQTESAEIIMAQVSHLPSDVPALLVGDFNADPSRPCYGVFTGQEHSFKDVFDEPFPGTYHGFSGETDGKHIDWILYRGGIAPEGASVVRYAADGVYPSDHFPVYAVFKWG